MAKTWLRKLQQRHHLSDTLHKYLTLYSPLAQGIFCKTKIKTYGHKLVETLSQEPHIFDKGL